MIPDTRYLSGFGDFYGKRRMKRTKNKNRHYERSEAISILFSPLHCRAGLLRRNITLIMQNEPNFHGSRATGHESRFIKNEPNSNRKSTTENRKSLNLFTHIRRTFHRNSQKMRTFLNFWTKTHLSPDISKAYKTFHPRIRFTLQKMRETKK